MASLKPVWSSFSPPSASAVIAPEPSPQPCTCYPPSAGQELCPKSGHDLISEIGTSSLAHLRSQALSALPIRSRGLSAGPVIGLLVESIMFNRKLIGPYKVLEPSPRAASEIPPLRLAPPHQLS